MRGTLLALALVAVAPGVAAQEVTGEVPLTEADLAALSAEGKRDASTAPLSASELAALGLGAGMPAVDRRLTLSGFADFSLSTALIKKNSVWRSLNVSSVHPSFYLGNINVYLSKFVTDSVYMLGEIRFSYLPNGSSDFGREARTDTTASDYNDFGRAMRWGGIEIERFQLDWIAHPKLTVRMGQFLTPFGVWNVDHGSPTVITPRKPWPVGVGWFPERQTGIELLGGLDVSRYGSLGYHLTLSNGTGPVSEYADLDDNKAIGGRLFWQYRRLGRLRVGASAYYGRDTDASTGLAANAQGVYESVERIKSQYDSLALAGDVVWTHRGWHLQTEWIVHQRAYTKKGRTLDALPLSSQAVPSDLVSWGGYVLAGYRLPWFGIMPFLLVERDRTLLSAVPVNLYSLQSGINVRPGDALVFKLSYEQLFVSRTPNVGREKMRSLQAQIAWAF